MKKAKEVKQDVQELDPMSAYAKRIWDNQSVTLSLRERVERIVKGLNGQGFSDMSGLKLPVEGFERYLK